MKLVYSLLYTKTLKLTLTVQENPLLLKRNVLCPIFTERWDKEHDFLSPSFAFLLRRETVVNAARTAGPENSESRHCPSTECVPGSF